MKHTGLLAFCLLFLMSCTGRDCSPSLAGLPHVDPQATFVNVTPAMLTAEHWIRRLPNPNEILATPAQIEDTNARARVALPEAIRGLRETPPTFAADEIRQRIVETELPSGDLHRWGGERVTDEWLAALAAERNLESLVEPVAPRFGYVVRRTNMRALPTHEGLGRNPLDRTFDILQFTGIDPLEPVVILHESRSGEFLFVRTWYCDGWVQSSDVAHEPDRAAWERRLEPGDFLVVTAPFFVLPKQEHNNASLRFHMGSRLPVVAGSSAEGVVVETIVRGKDGTASYEHTPVSSHPGLRRGWLPYSRANVLRLAFSMLGEPYGWGGLNGLRDCSAFIREIFAAFGFRLPRNSSVQVKMPARVAVDFPGLENPETALIEHLSPGAVLGWPGHIVLFVGAENGRAFAIHDAGMQLLQVDGKLERAEILKVVVSDLHVMGAQGQTYLERLVRGFEL